MNPKNHDEEPTAEVEEPMYYRYAVEARTHSPSGREWVSLCQFNDNGALCAETHISPFWIPHICSELQNAHRAFFSKTRKGLGGNVAAHCEFLKRRNGGKPWTDEEETLLVHLHLERYELEQIAIRLGRSNGAVTTRLRKLGFTEERGW